MSPRAPSAVWSWYRSWLYQGPLTVADRDWLHRAGAFVLRWLGVLILFLAAVVPVAEAVEGRPSGASGGIASSIAWGAAMLSLSIALLAFAGTVRMSATESRARQSGWRAALIGALLLGGSANVLLGLVVLGQHQDGWSDLAYGSAGAALTCFAVAIATWEDAVR